VLEVVEVKVTEGLLLNYVETEPAIQQKIVDPATKTVDHADRLCAIKCALKIAIVETREAVPDGEDVVHLDAPTTLPAPVQ